MTTDREDKLIPLDDETRAAIEAVLAEAMEHKEQNRLAKMFDRQMSRASGAGSDETLRPPFLTYVVRRGR